MEFVFFVLLCLVCADDVDLSKWDGLKHLQSKTRHEYVEAGRKYIFNVHTEIKDPLCQIESCVVGFDEASCACSGTLDSEQIIAYTNGNLRFKYKYGNYNATVNLKCHPQVYEVVFFATGSVNDVIVDVLSKYACPKSIITWGVIFCIIVLIGIVVYFAVGMPIMALKFKKRGKEILPFFSYIVLFFGCIKDGVLFILPLNRCRKGVQGYDVIA